MAKFKKQDTNTSQLPTRDRPTSFLSSEQHDLMLHAVDEDDWQTGLAKLPNRWRLLFASDLHLPDYDPRAWEVALKIIEAAKPDVMPHGSDALDFGNASVKWPQTVRDLAEDAWTQTSDVYFRVMREANDAAPDKCLKPFLMGNHDFRGYMWILKNAPQFTNHMSAEFVGLVRACGGLWLGIDTIELELTPEFLLAHGHQFGAAEAKAIGYKTGWSHNILAAHIHRHTFQAKTTRTGRRKVMTVGCLCNLTPAYLTKKGRGSLQDWHHGIGIADVDRKRGTVDFQPVDIEIARGKYYARWADTEFSA